MDPVEGFVQVNGPAVENVWMLLVVPWVNKFVASPVNPCAINEDIAG
jgi:hypothetical protein